MAPYYESWETSSHANIKCVDCHIAPGITAEFEKKYEAMAMVARYFTGTYGTRPWTEIEDAAYLECHAQVDTVYRDPDEWTRRVVHNLANVGCFSSDRTIREYATEIWGIEPVKIEMDAETD